MFKLNNLFSNAATTISIAHGNKSVEFTIGTVINKRHKDELDNVHQFTLIESYLDHKGEAFKSKLMDLYVKAEEKMVFDSVGTTNNGNLPLEITHDILNLMNIDDVYDYIKNVYRLRPLPNLKDRFDKKAEMDGYVTKDQTYVKDEYLQLAALSVILKSVMGVIANYAYINNSNFLTEHREYLLFKFISTHPVFESSAMNKLYGFIDIIVRNSVDSNKKEDRDATAVRTITKLIAKEETTMYVLSQVALHKVAIAPIVDDTPTNNVITKCYNYLNNKLAVHSDVPGTIRDKSVGLDTDSNIAGEQESRLEMVRMGTAITKGSEVTFNWATSSINMILNQMDIEIDHKVLKDVRLSLSRFNTGLITNEQRYLLAPIFKGILHPKSIVYLGIDNMLDLMAVGFAYLWSLDLKYMAVLITSHVITNSEGVAYSVNSTSSVNRIPKELKDEISFYFPRERVLNEEQAINAVEESINIISKEYYSKRWIPTVSEEYYEQVEGGLRVFKTLPPDLKVKMAEYFVTLEKNRR